MPPGDATVKNEASSAARRSARLHAASIVWDNHVCLPMEPERNVRALPQLEAFRRAGVDVVSLNAGYGTMGWERSVALLAAMRHWLAARPDDYRLAATAADVEAAARDGRLAVVFDLEGATALEGRPELVRLFRDLGVRWMLMAYNRGNWTGAGCHDADDHGLTAAGAELMAEMERVGVTVCCSHAGPRTAADILERARRPVIFSHSNAAALRPHPRNIGDDLIRACARTGGVVGLNGVNIFLGAEDAGLPELVAHVEHVAAVAGPDGVSLALDWAPPEELAVALGRTSLFPAGHDYEKIRILGPEALLRLTDFLLGRGWPDADVAKLLGGNLLRIAREGWTPMPPAGEQEHAPPA